MVWEYTADEVVHHDAHKLDNGNYLFLKRTTLPYPESWLPKGRDPEKFSVRSDSVVEITADGKLVWDWHFHDAFDLAECGWRGCKRDRFSKPGQVVPDRNFIDWSHANTSSVIPPNRWHDAGDKRFTPGNILVLPRSFWTMYLVDRESKEIVWSYHGNPSDENPGDGLIRGHESYMIPKGLPGAGNILVFDNGISKVRSYSRVLEVNPTTKEIVWKYEAPGEFFTDGGGVAQRLPNGNTLVSEDKDARVFEVTQSGEVVWDIRGKYRVTRARRYPSGYCKHLQEEESK